MKNEAVTSMRSRLIQEGSGFFVVSLICLQLAAQNWGDKAPRGVYHWWVPGVMSAGVVVTLFILHLLYPKVGLLRIVGVGVCGLVTSWAGYALGSVGLDYRFFLVIGASLLVGAIVLCACIFCGRLANVFKVPIDYSHKWISFFVLIGFMALIIRTYAGMADAKVGEWATTLLLVVMLVVAFVLTIVGPEWAEPR